MAQSDDQGPAWFFRWVGYHDANRGMARVWMPPVWQEEFLTAVCEQGILSVVCQAS
jgi:hypothetical protein